ncbi:hypothetical protein Daus18300_002696 [Diaporthe australafricana]|uniref:AAA+ ATPase domain-containing protein n=1 Tax=Diaporthe australafricana TaxID=127596 RepID=A0ABR3XKD8_9PEZI
MSFSQDNPAVVGIYGVSGCGKTTLVARLMDNLREQDFAFFDGSQVLDRRVPGGLAAFKQMIGTEKSVYRELATQSIAAKCRSSGRVGVVAGDLTFWTGTVAVEVHTQADLETYTHILYLDTPAETISEYRRNDRTQSRPQMSVDDLRRWQGKEKSLLKDLCRDHGIMLLIEHVSLEDGISRIAGLIKDIRVHSEDMNMFRASGQLDNIMGPLENELKTVLVFDADNTLASIDTEARFWGEHLGLGKDDGSKLKQLFSHPAWDYSYKAFRQATWLYEEIPEPEFERLCGVVANDVVLHPELDYLLQCAEQKTFVRVLVVTGGIKRIWENVLQRCRPSANVAVIGGGRVSDGLVVTPGIKASIVRRLRWHYWMKVYAFGDSEVDIPMLRAADHAFVVTGDVETRSESMDQALERAVQDGLRARQILLPAGSSPRLAKDMVPVIEMDSALVTRILSDGHVKSRLGPLGQIHVKESMASQLLTTPMRNAYVDGPALREAHRKAGWWLAIQHISEMIGCEKTGRANIQQRWTEGYRLLGEEQTVIVALMRGSEPMALGVSEAFPAALLVHANAPQDLDDRHLTQKRTILLVDSVVNSGETVNDFVEHVRRIDKTVRIVVIASVIENKVFDRSFPWMYSDSKVGFVTMRLSDYGFKERTKRDITNRLYNTPHLH